MSTMSTFAGELAEEIEEKVAKVVLPLILNRARADVAELIRTAVVAIDKEEPLTDEQRSVLEKHISEFTFHSSKYRSLFGGKFEFDPTPAVTPIVIPIKSQATVAADEDPLCSARPNNKPCTYTALPGTDKCKRCTPKSVPAPTKTQVETETDASTEKPIVQKKTPAAKKAAAPKKAPAPLETEKDDATAQKPAPKKARKTAPPATAKMDDEIEDDD